MAGSQLKQLKASLKANGLTGQSNVKKNKKSKKTATEIRRDERAEIISGIREQFNRFDTKTNRTKHDFTVIQGGKFVKSGSKQHSNPSRAKSMVEENLRMQYGVQKARHGRTGGLVDRRFGENNKNMTNEEKMLERFTRERERQSKRNVFALGSDDEGDDEDDGGFQLTHYGKSLALEEAAASDNDEDLMPADEPQRKKTKAEVMKEVMAKSKFYKHQRQQEHQKALDNIMDLDEDFDEVMQDLNSTAAAAAKPTRRPEDIEYDSKVRELTYDRRSVPADRTKTEEEVAREHEAKLKALETARVNRMNGLDEERAQAGDDLDDNFWNGSDGEQAEASDEQAEASDDSDELKDDVVAKGSARGVPRTSVSMPLSAAEFGAMVTDMDASAQAALVQKICKVYQPRLAAGNKEKMGQFTSILFEHIMAVADKPQPSQESINLLMTHLKQLSETYNEQLVATVRQRILVMQERIVSHQYLASDLLFYSVIGFLFSTSDHYHLIVTPTLILMNETLSNIQYNAETSYQQCFVATFILSMLLKYTSYSKRLVPESLQSIERVLLALIPSPRSIAAARLNVSHITTTECTLPRGFQSRDTSTTISLHKLQSSSASDQDKFNLLQRNIDTLGGYIDVWKEYSAFPEIAAPFIVILKHMAKFFAHSLTGLPDLLNKAVKLEQFALRDRKPLALQDHKALSIVTFAPKFEENFNPDKKSYDVNRERQEISKIKAQVKKEKKSALKDLRKESRFVAREQIKDKKDMYANYHKKMASIVNSISTVEGAEKNQYAREKQQRKGKK